MVKQRLPGETVHGMYKTLTYFAWGSMMQRCYSESHRSFRAYGAKGIRVVDRWHAFVNFLEDMGEKPNGTTLARLDVEDDYHPDNCKWSTSLEKHGVRKNGVLVLVNGEVMAPQDAITRYGIKHYDAYRRLPRVQQQ